MRPTAQVLQELLHEHGSNRAVARHLRVDEKTVRRWRQHLQVEEEPESSLELKGDTAKITTPLAADVELGDMDDMIRSRGLEPADWEVEKVTINEREGLGKDREVTTFRQLRINLVRRMSFELLSPAQHVPSINTKSRAGRASSEEPEFIVVEGDHQVPYHDPALHEASLMFLADTQPQRHIFLGDTVDLPNISRHNDNAVFNASVQECIQKGYELLREKREAAPNARAVKLAGNHDWRLPAELLARAERLSGIKPADTGNGPEEDALSLSRLMHFDALGIEYICPPQGWQHGEVELSSDLVVRHGWLTGAKTAEKTLAKLGRSAIVGHGHQREHAFKLAYGSGPPKQRQAVVAGTMSRLDLPYVVNPDWSQGFVTVTLWPDGNFIIEHAVWMDGSLYWRDKRWSP